MKEQAFYEIIRLGIVGVIATLIHYGIYGVLQGYMHHSIAYTFGYGICFMRFNKKEIKFNRGDRTYENSSFNIIKLFNLAIEGIASFSTSPFPLHISSTIGIIIPCIALI